MISHQLRRREEGPVGRQGGRQGVEEGTETVSLWPLAP